MLLNRITNLSKLKEELVNLEEEGKLSMIGNPNLSYKTRKSIASILFINQSLRNKVGESTFSNLMLPPSQEEGDEIKKQFLLELNKNITRYNSFICSGNDLVYTSNTLSNVSNAIIFNKLVSIKLNKNPPFPNIPQSVTLKDWPIFTFPYNIFSKEEVDSILSRIISPDTPGFKIEKICFKESE